MKEYGLDYVKTRSAVLEEQKNKWIPTWQETARWVAPWRGRFSGQAENVFEVHFTPTSNTGGDSRILDATATRALRLLAAGLHSGLTSPARPWFRLRRSGEKSMESGPERRWLDGVEEALYGAFSSSNFYQAIHGLYTELALFGSATMYMESDSEHVMRFATLNCGEFSWVCNASGRVDTVLRRMHMTARQMAELYGEDNLTEETRKKLAKNAEQPCEVFHLVEPRFVRDVRRMDNKNKPFASYVWEASSKSQQLLHEGGYEEFPFLCARWDVQGNAVYGASPAMETLPDIRMLQEMTKSQLLAIHKVVNPPMRVPAGFKQRLSLIPGAINYINPNQPEGIGPLYQISPDIASLTRKIEDVRESVKQGFFNDLFLMFSGEGRSNITATEILEREQEKLLMLGPVIERHQTEILDPLLVRAFGILERFGSLVEPPENLQGQALRIEYVSSLAQIQRLDGAEGIRRLTQEVASLAAVSPQVLDKIDFDQAVDELASIAGVAARVVRSDSEVETLRAERVQAEKEQMQMAQGTAGLTQIAENIPEMAELLSSITGGANTTGTNNTANASTTTGANIDALIESIAGDSTGLEKNIGS